MQIEYISILSDETSNVGHHEQLSIVLRYFDSNTNRLVDTLFGLQRIVSVTADSIFEALCCVVNYNFGINWSSIVSVCFDGAATMAGNIGGVQKNLKQMNDNILYVHCNAHCFNFL